MKKVVLASLFSIFSLQAQSFKPLTIQETLNSIGLIVGTMTTIQEEEKQDAMMLKACELMTAMVDKAFIIAQHAQIPTSAPLTTLIDHLESNKKFISALYICKNPIDELEAVGHHGHKPANHQSPDDDHVAELVLSTFVNIAGNFASIATDPHNPRVVGPNLVGMLAGILNVAREACKKSCLQVSETYQEAFKDIVLAQALATRVARMGH